MREQLQQMQADGTLEQLIEQLIERMERENYISVDDPHDPSRQLEHGRAGGAGSSKRSSKSPTKAWIFWDTRHCAI